MPHDSDPGAPAPAPHVGPRCTPQEGLELAAVIGGGDWTLAWSAGEIVSTPADASRWMAVLGSGAVVDAEHLQLMTTPSPQSIAALQDMAAFGSMRWTGKGLGLMQYEIDGHSVRWGVEGPNNGFVANVVYMVDSGSTFSVTSNFAMTDSFAALGDLVVAAGG
ncbi:MAG: serine hydrolase [Candidatus Nanopelagicales bacterium]|nr:serine hydrolase [Candidatus Nanopelagicales bacterium]